MYSLLYISGKDFSAPCLQIFAFVVEFNRRHFAYTSAEESRRIGELLQHWISATAQGGDEHNLARHTFQNFAIFCQECNKIATAASSPSSPKQIEAAGSSASTSNK
mmetsp:Transcript_17802/g.31879  ORF Transcript_17802/g.31879 Transcript_17802/m.31879 type:complete len:106 (-) Transcript_17802:632-949(-)